MPKFVLQLSAQLQGVSSFATPSEYPWHVTLGCGNCGEKTGKPVVLSSADHVEGIRGATVNMRITCKLCSRVNDVKVIEEGKPYTSENAPEWGSFVVVECRGLELLDVAFADDVPLTILGAEGFVFEDAFIEDGEFYGYDEKLSAEASITELRTRVVRG